MTICCLGDLVLDVIVRLEQPLATGADAASQIVLRPGGQAANVAAWIADLGGNAILVGRPPTESLDVAPLIEEAVAAAARDGVRGQAVIPFVLAYLHEHSDGETRRVNRDLIVDNAGLAGAIATAHATLCGAPLMSLYDSVRNLPLTVESYSLDGLEQQVSSEFLRKTTVIHLQGGGEEGLGEDVTYEATEHDLVQSQGPVHELGGQWTLDSFSEHLETLELFDHEPEQHVYTDYRRWAYESAALDLALRQAGLSLGAVVGRTPGPLTFVVSMRLGEPATTERLRAWLDLYPGLRFKLDATPDWTDELIAELAATGAVDSVDFKGQYHGTSVDTVPDADLYQRIVAGLPHAWLEDPALTPETEAVLEPENARVTWDAVIHSVADIEALRWPPRTVNIKPSRLGSVAKLFSTYDYCEAREIGAYGGGQFELGVGRDQIQLLAALFHPGTPNDVAPGGFNVSPTAGLPASPLTVTERPTGFATL